MDDLTKELWQGVTERVNRPEPVYQLLSRSEPPLAVADQSGWREFLVSRKMAATLALACVLGLLGIVSANPFASASVSERVSDKLGRPATCTERGATIGADSHQTIYRCIVGSKTNGLLSALRSRGAISGNSAEDANWAARATRVHCPSVRPGRSVGLTQSCPVRPRRPRLP